jgi:DNA primase
MPGYIKQSKIDEILYKADIFSVINSYITLSKSGNQYKAICPFHNEKTPSLIVTPHKGLFHCFGCGAGGNVINFVMKIENLSFVEAVNLLADRYNIQLEDYNDKALMEKHNFNKRLYSINRDAANIFYKQLYYSSPAKNYILNRGLNIEIIKEFGIGYSKDAWESLLNNLLKKGYTKTEFLKSGLGNHSAKSDKIYDKFRNRIMFPIQDISGRVIGFGGRVINDSDNPKYLNTAETDIFTKGRHLYNLNRAKAFCQDYLILVEGYMDVVALASAGVKNAIASLGTALTTNQALLIKQYNKTVYLSYDSDEAGISATIKNAQLLDDMGLDVKIITLNKAKDPDEFIRKFGIEEFLSLINKSVDVYIYKLNQLQNTYGAHFDTNENRAKYATNALHIISKIPDVIRLEAYIDYISQVSKIPTGTIKQQLEKNKQGGDGTIKFKPQQKNEVKQGIIIAQEKIISILSNNNDIYQNYKYKLKNLEFKEGILKDTLEFIIIACENKKIFNPSEYISLLKNENDVQYISKILLDNKFVDKNQMPGYINIVTIDNINKKIADIKSKYTNALKTNNVILANDYLIQINELKKSIEIIKGGAI